MPQVTSATPTPAPASMTPPAPAPPAAGGQGNGAGAPGPRRPARAAILGFTLTIACGGIALLVMSGKRAPAPEVSAPDPGDQVAAMPAGGGMIVVPTAPPGRGAGSSEQRRNGPARASSVRRDPRMVARLSSHTRNSHHLYDPRAYGAPPAAGEPAVATRAPGTSASEPGLQPPAAPPPPSASPGAAGARLDPGKPASGGIAHKLRATSIPSEAEVLLDGKSIGRTPLFGAEVDVSQPHTLTIRKDGYAPFEQTVTASSAWVVRPSDNVAALRVAPVLQKQKMVVSSTPSAQFQDRTAVAPVAAGAGAPSAGVLAATSHKLRITSIPSDAQVSIDGQVVGRTPLFGAELDLRSPHRLAIRKDGYALFEQTITASSEWSVKPSDPTSALLRVSVLLKPGDPTLAQSPTGTTP
jgi:hypothetical protein